MKVVYLINGLNGGGAAFPMVQVLGLMQELGHEVKVLALLPQDGKAGPRLAQAGISWEVLGSRPWDLIAPALRLVRRLRADRPDLLWTSLTRATLYGQLAGRLLDIPVVSWQHSDYLKPANLAFLRRTRRLSSRWIADSEAVAEFARTRLGIAADRLDIWPPFVADPDLPAASAWPGSGPLRLGSLGRLHHSKQYAVLLRAFARARDLDAASAARLELHLAGDGEERAALESLAAELGLGTALLLRGFVSPPAEFLSGLHGYVQTSLKEGFCIAAHEAMLAGLPVIATRVGELARSVRPGETGWLCEVGDVEALARAMLELASDPARAAAMGAAARAQVLERHSRERFRSIGERLLQVISREVADGRRDADAARSASSQHR